MGLEAATYIAGLNTANPVATDTKSQGDDHLRLIKSVLQTTFPGADVPFYISADRVDLASAAAINLGAQTSQYINITGTTTITSFGTANAGVWRLLRFNAALILTHNATSLILPTGANITTEAGDHALAFSRGSGNWIVLFYARQAGDPLTMPDQATTTARGTAELATAAEMVTGTDANRVPSVSVVKNHEGVAKAWVRFNSAGTIQNSHGVSSVVRNSEGVYQITLSATMANGNYVAVATCNDAPRFACVVSTTTTTVLVSIRNPNGAAVDSPCSVAVFGTLA